VITHIYGQVFSETEMGVYVVGCVVGSVLGSVLIEACVECLECSD
jgi:hypothetical protein